MTSNLYSMLRDRFAPRGSEIFLKCPGNTPLTYEGMDQLCARYVTALQAVGVGPDDRVVVQVEKMAATVALYLACLRLGAIYVPLNTAYTAAEVEFFVTDCEPRLFVVTASRQAELEVVAKRAGVALTLPLSGADNSLAQRAERSEPCQVVVGRSEDDLAAIVYTSGTTGRAKGAMLTIGSLMSNGLALHDVWGWRGSDVLLHALPVFHVHGLFVALHCAMLSGSQVLFLPRFDVAAVRAALPQATVMMGVPTFYTRLLADGEFSAAQCQQMRLFISGSAPLSEQTFNEFEARTGHRILERYGMSEAGMITSNPLKGPRLPGTVGFALPEVEVRVAGDDGTVAGADEVGVLEVRGSNLFRGYWGLPDKTAAEFRPDGFFITGDLGLMGADGRVSIVGRARDLIISGGYNIYPKEIEGYLDEMPGVMESAVVGAPHADFGEAAIAVIVPEQPGSVDVAVVQRALDTQMARFKHPKQFFLVDALPRNTMGKVQKNMLRERYRSVFAGDTP